MPAFLTAHFPLQHKTNPTQQFPQFLELTCQCSARPVNRYTNWRVPWFKKGFGSNILGSGVKLKRAAEVVHFYLLSACNEMLCKWRYFPPRVGLAWIKTSFFIRRALLRRREWKDANDSRNATVILHSIDVRKPCKMVHLRYWRWSSSWCHQKSKFVSQGWHGVSHSKEDVDFCNNNF